MQISLERRPEIISGTLNRNPNNNRGCLNLIRLIYATDSPTWDYPLQFTRFSALLSSGRFLAARKKNSGRFVSCHQLKSHSFMCSLYLSYFIIRQHSQFGALISVKPTLKGVSGLLVVGHERYNTKKGMKAIEKGSSRQAEKWRSKQANAN